MRREDQRHHRAQRQRHVDRRQHEHELGHARQRRVDPSRRLAEMPPISAPSSVAPSVAIDARPPAWRGRRTAAARRCRARSRPRRAAAAARRSPASPVTSRPSVNQRSGTGRDRSSSNVRSRRLTSAQRIDVGAAALVRPNRCTRVGGAYIRSSKRAFGSFGASHGAASAAATTAARRIAPGAPHAASALADARIDRGQQQIADQRADRQQGTRPSPRSRRRDRCRARAALRTSAARARATR